MTANGEGGDRDQFMSEIAYFSDAKSKNKMPTVAARSSGSN